MADPVKKEKMSALPSFMYGDPAECVDEIRRQRALEKRKLEQQRKNKSRRIQVMVRLAMKGARR